MTGIAQFILLIVIVTLTFLITFVAVQVFHILHDFRQVLKRINGVQDPDLVGELKNIVKDSKSEIIKHTAQRIQTQVEKKNFFKRAGSPLRPS